MTLPDTPLHSVLYDGWSLIYQPNSPQSLHLLAILSCRLEGFQGFLALPGEPPDWLPPVTATRVIFTANMPRNRLLWEQRILPGLRRELEADLLHLTSPTPPLFGPAVNVVSPSGFGGSHRVGGFSSRLRQAVSQGGMARLAGLFWPDDLPDPKGMGAVYRLPPAIPVEFFDLGSKLGDRQLVESLDLPETYVLYHGPAEETALRRLLNAWSWVAGSVGEMYPLLAIGLEDESRKKLDVLAASFDLGETVRSLPAMPPKDLGLIYQRCVAVLHPGDDSPWGGPVRLALASGKPVVSQVSEHMDALVGPAAYLVKGGEARALGAALITVLVEEEIAERLSQLGRQRAEAWSLETFSQGLLAAYQDMLSKQNK